MRVVTLIENTAPEGLIAEWGLSLYIEYRGKKYLLDSGTTDRFIQNAKTLGVDLAEVDSAVLSHAHYDHAGGMEAFFQVNEKAKYHLQKAAQEKQYAKALFVSRYIGLEQGMSDRRKDRIVWVEGDLKLDEGVYLIPHKTDGLGAIGRKAHLYVKKGGKLVPDDFAHEQSLVFETEKGLVIFNSCSHGGVANIIREVKETFPGKDICAMIGGFHLYGKRRGRLRAIAREISDTGVPLIYTGHCTGSKAFQILKDAMGDRVQYLATGTVIEMV